MDVSDFSFNAADPASWQARMLQGDAAQPERLEAATREFEAILLRQFLQEALEPLPGAPAALGGGNPVYGYMVADVLASGLSNGGAFGFSNLLQAQLTGAITNDNDTDNHISS